MHWRQRCVILSESASIAPTGERCDLETMTKHTRTETDSMGEMEVCKERLWGAQTQRSLENFKIGDDRMPMALIHGLAQVKRAAAQVNLDLGEFKDPAI